MQFVVTEEKGIIMLNSVAGISVDGNRILATMWDMETIVELGIYIDDYEANYHMGKFQGAMERKELFFDFSEEE